MIRCRVVLLSIHGSEESIASIIKAKGISLLGTILTVASYR
jgi:hypothetical protein